MRSMFSRLLVGSAALVLGSSSIASAAPGVFRTSANDVIVFDVVPDADVKFAQEGGAPTIKTGSSTACGLAIVSVSATTPPATMKVWAIGTTEPTAALTVASLPAGVLPTCTAGVLSTPVTAAFKTADSKVVVPNAGVSGTVMISTTSPKVKVGKANSCGFYVAKSSATAPTLGTTQIAVTHGAATTPQFPSAAVSTLAVKSNLPVCRKSTSATGTVTSVTYVPAVGW